MTATKITITRESWEAVNESLHRFLDEVIAGPICEVVNYDTNQSFTFTDSEVKIKQVTETGSFTVTMTRAEWDNIGHSWGTAIWPYPLNAQKHGETLHEEIRRSNALLKVIANRLSATSSFCKPTCMTLLEVIRDYWAPNRTKDEYQKLDYGTIEHIAEISIQVAIATNCSPTDVARVLPSIYQESKRPKV